MKAQSPLLGYNNNVPHKGRMYHVQTEDSGTRRPHIITHLFADGGRVVTSNKTSYADVVGDEDVVDKVREMMREQHKAMVIALRDGAFDALIDEGAEVATGETLRSADEPDAEAVGDQGVAMASQPFLDQEREEEEADEAMQVDVFADEPPLPAPPPVPVRSGASPLAQTIAWDDGAPATPEVPVDVLERLAAEAERELYTEFRALAMAPEAAEATSPGAYRFIGRPGSESQRPARARTMAMDAHGASPRRGPEDRRHSDTGPRPSLPVSLRSPVPRTPVMPDSAPDPFEDDDYAEHVSRQIERARIDRLSSNPGMAPGGLWVFGASVLGERRLDELMVQFLRERLR